MKKYLLSLCFILVSFVFLNAQANLQFNQVINQSFSLTDNNNNFQSLIMGSITVPVGKVYKIESASMMAKYNTRVGAHYKAVSLGDHLVWIAPDDPIDLFPLWLSPGTYPIEFLNHGNGSTYEYKFSISAIEFNVVP